MTPDDPEFRKLIIDNLYDMAIACRIQGNLMLAATLFLLMEKVREGKEADIMMGFINQVVDPRFRAMAKRAGAN